MSKSEIVGDGEKNREVGIQVTDTGSDQPDMQRRKEKGSKVKCQNEFKHEIAWQSMGPEGIEPSASPL